MLASKRKYNLTQFLTVTHAGVGSSRSESQASGGRSPGSGSLSDPQVHEDVPYIMWSVMGR